MAEPEDGRLAIGIDLGTTNCRVGIWLDEENRFQLISDDHGCQSTPSYVAFTETERLIGDAAKAQVAKNPVNTIFDAKRLIGRKFSDLGTDAIKMHVQWPFRVARDADDKPALCVEYKGKEKMFPPTEVCAMVLGKMKDLAEVYSSSVVTGACVSVPHCFNSAQRQAIRKACSLAGFESVALVNEPVCAALAYTLNTIGPSLGEKNVVVFDLGGGTLDVSLVTIDGGVVEVKATSGESQLGGEDFDLRLLHHFIQEIKQKHEHDITSHPRVMRRLKQQVERVKVALSSESETTIHIDSLLEDFSFSSTISRACFEEMNMDLFRKCITHVEECLRRAKMPKQEVDEVVLVGGSSRIPKVQELLADFFNDMSKLNTSINPDEAVVCGAAARAGIDRECSAFGDYRVVDVVPMTLGLETVGGEMHVMLPRGGAVPKSSEQVFTTVHDDQPGILIHVYEGENPHTCENLLVATIELPGIAPASAGAPQVLVRFDVDAYGMLTVSAKDKTNGEKVEIYMDQEGDIVRPHLDEELRQRLPIQVFRSPSPSANGNDHTGLERPHEPSNANAGVSISPRVFRESSIQSSSRDDSEAYESRNSEETRSQEVPEPSEPAIESGIVEEFFESPQSFESSSSFDSKSLHPPEISATTENSAQELPEPLQALDSGSTVEVSESQELSSEPPASEPTDAIEKSSSRVSLVEEILDTAHVITPISDFKSHKKECSTFIRRVNMLVPLFEEVRDLELSLSLSEDVLACFKSVERALNSARDLILLCSKGSKLWLVLEEGKVTEQFLLLNTALVQALDKLPDSLGVSDEVRDSVDLVHSHLKRSKAMEDSVDAQLNAELVSILDRPTDRSPDQLKSLAESFKLDTASALRKEFEALGGMAKGTAPSFVSTRGFDQIFGLLSDLRAVFPSEVPEWHEYFKPSEAHEEPSHFGDEGRSQKISAPPPPPPPPPPSNSSSSFEASSSQDSSAQAPEVNRGVESSSQELFVHPAQVNREAESSFQECSAQPTQVNGGAGSSSQDLFSQPPQVSGGVEISQPPRSPYSSSNSMDERSLNVYSEPAQVERIDVYSEPAQVERGDVFSKSAHVDRDEKTELQEFSAPQSTYKPSHGFDGRKTHDHSEAAQDRRSKSKFGSWSSDQLPSQSASTTPERSDESPAQPPRSPYSSSNSIDGRSLDVHSEPAQVERIDVYSESAQVNRDEKMKLQDFSAPQSTYKPSHSFDHRPPHDHSEAPSKSTFGSRSSDPLASHSASTTPEKSEEFPAQPLRSPYSSSNSIDERSLDVHSEPTQVGRDDVYSVPAQVGRDEKMKSHESSAPQLPTYKPSHSCDLRPPHDHAELSPQAHTSTSTFGSKSSTTPERSQEFSDYSSKPEFPEHSPGVEYKAWSSLEGKAPAPAEPLPTHRLSSSSSPSGSRCHENFERSPSSRSSSTSEVSSGESSGSGPQLRGAVHQHAASEPPAELRRSGTSADDQHLPPRPENARSTSCPLVRSSDHSIIEDVVKRYSWEQVLDLTSGLTKTIGKGGFGAVYLGKLETEKEVAVKVLDASSQQGITEFLNEVNLLKRVNHVNLVRLFGYCLDEDTNKQVLIYEFAEEGSIWDHLQVGGKSLDWKTRLSVALQSAVGLEYLHTGCHPRIIHRDIKSQNILLTKAMVAKVADFGLSKLGADQDNVSKTHVTTMVKGTLGYLDPEYLKTGQLTEKSDVYSFGVVLLEIVTGRKPIQNSSRKGFLGDWVEDHYNSNSSSSRGLKAVADPTLGGHFNSKALRTVLNVAKECIQPYGMDRPEMTEVVHALRKAQMLEHDEKKSSKWLPFL